MHSLKSALLDRLPLDRTRRPLWRLGRALYMRARNEPVNVLELNGERLMQRGVLAAYKDQRDPVVVLDVGANVGDWTLSLMQEADALGAASGLQVHCFEPIAATFETLQARLGGYTTAGPVVARRLALSNANGSTTMFCVGENRGTNSLHQDPTVTDAEPVTIELATADQYCEEHGIDQVHYLKIDTEGHDFAVIEGCQGLLDAARIAVLQLEYNHRWVYSRHFLKDVFDRADGIPYRVGKLTARGLEIYDRWHPELERFFEANYALIREDALPYFPHRLLRADAANTFA